MDERISFSNEQLDLQVISQHHDDVTLALHEFFDPASPSYTVHFVGETPAAVRQRLAERLREYETATCLSILSSIEASLRVDYLQRRYKKKRDPVSRAFRNLYRAKQSRANLEDEILEVWATYSPVPRTLISDLRSAFKYRHWLAHGRYWVPKLGRKFDYVVIFALAQKAEALFPFF
jgi:ribosomal protein S26